MSVCNYSMNKDFKFHYVFMHIFSFFGFSSLILWDRFLPIEFSPLRFCQNKKNRQLICKISRKFCQRHFLIRDDLFTTWLLCRPLKKGIFFPNYTVFLNDCLFWYHYEKAKNPQNPEYKYIFYIISVGHLIISNKSRGKNITTYISNILKIEFIFRKFVNWRRILILFIIQMSITPKVFGLEKRNCTF